MQNFDTEKLVSSVQFTFKSPLQTNISNNNYVITKDDKGKEQLLQQDNRTSYRLYAERKISRRRSSFSIVHL